MFVVDTNIFIYAAEKQFPEHRRCRDLVNEWRRRADAWFTTWGIMYEFLRVTTHPSVFNRSWSIPEAWGFVEAVLASRGLEVLVETRRHSAVMREVAAELPDLRGNLVHDAHTAVLMREHGIGRIYTRDTDFHRFPFIETIDPLT